VPFSFILCKELGLKFPEKKIIKMDKLFRDEFVKFISFNEEWRSLLTFFNRKFLLGIVSNYDEATVKKILKRFSLARFFKLIVGIDTTGYEKSKLVPFIYALKKLRVKPTEVLMIGDDEYQDIIPAKKLGILTIKIKKRENKKTFADYEVNNCREILTLSQLKALFFDLGGTLVDTEKIRKDVNFYINILARCDIPITKEKFIKARKKVELFLNKKERKSGMFFSLLLKELEIKPNKKILKELINCYRAGIVQKAKLRPEAKRVLPKLKKKFILGLVANVDKYYGTKLIDKFNLRKYFDVIAISEELGYEKSKLVPFIYALKKLRVKPTEVLMIGDDEYQDIIPAKKLGILTIKIVKNWQEKTSANWKIKNLDEILQILRLTQYFAVK
jgi:putative hydrolase of the HAD superfamily